MVHAASFTFTFTFPLPLPLPGVAPNREPWVDVTKIKMDITDAFQVSQLSHAKIKSLRKMEVTHFSGGDLLGHHL